MIEYSTRSVKLQDLNLEFFDYVSINIEAFCSWQMVNGGLIYLKDYSTLWYCVQLQNTVNYWNPRQLKISMFISKSIAKLRKLGIDINFKLWVIYISFICFNYLLKKIELFQSNDLKVNTYFWAYSNKINIL